MDGCVAGRLGLPYSGCCIVGGCVKPGLSYLAGIDVLWMDVGAGLSCLAWVAVLWVDVWGQACPALKGLLCCGGCVEADLLPCIGCCVVGGCVVDRPILLCMGCCVVGGFVVDRPILLCMGCCIVGKGCGRHVLPYKVAVFWDGVEIEGMQVCPPL